MDDARLFLKRRKDVAFSGPSGHRFYRSLIHEKISNDPGFATRLRAAALDAIRAEDAYTVRTGLQALSVIGESSDGAEIERLKEHPDPGVARDAVTCLFYLQRGS